MRHISGTLDFSKEGKSVITLGKFDGFHRGHQELISRVLKRKKPNNDTLIFTFDVSPVMKLSNPDFKVLLSNEERYHLAEKLGIDYLLECPFVSEIMSMSGEDFIRNILVHQLHAEHVVVGADFRFGHKRGGSARLLQKMGKELGFTVDVVEKVMDGHREISSTYIREEIAKGNIEKANELLGYSYFIEGEVIHGKHLGHTLEFPTINIKPAGRKLLPPYGVYVSQTKIGEREWKGITNIGVKPTVGKNEAGVETFLFDCQDNLYGERAVVNLLHFQRPEKKFDSVNLLKKQIQEDQILCRNYFEQVFTSDY